MKSLTLFLMATSAQVIDQLASVTGLLPSTLDRLLRALRAVDLVPTGGRGGGKNSAHYEVSHLVYVLLGLAGYQPSDGPEVARDLAALPHADITELIEEQNTEEQKVTLAEAPQPCGTLGESLAAWIRFAAGELDTPNRYDFRSWMLTLHLHPLSARIEFGFGRKRTGYLFDNDPILRPPRPMDRLTQLSGDTLLAVAQLLADTDRRLTSATTCFLDTL